MITSVVIPVRREKNISACLAGLFGMTVVPDEVIVVENDAEQPLRGVITEFPVRYECESVPGVYRARNRGLGLAQGDLVAFLDADCVPSRSWLAALRAGFQADAVGGVAGSTRNQTAALGLAAKYQREFLLHDGLQYLRPIFPAPYAPGGNVAYRKRVLQELDGFDTSFFSGGDADLAWRMQLAGYTLEYRGDAEVTVVPLASGRRYFARYYKYSLGQVMLYRKFRQFTGKRILFNSYPFVGLARACLLSATRGLYDLVLRRDPACLARCGMAFLEHTALLCGALVGSLRYRVIYI